MKTLGKLIKYIPVLLIVAVFSAFGVSAKVYGGTADGISWSIELNDGHMQINGNGEIADYVNHTSTPWASFITLAKKITVGEGITSVGNCAFMYARSAEEIVLPDSLRSIGDRAFAYCHSLESIKLPKELESIGISAFASDKSLAQVSFPKTLESIGAYAFSSCTSLEEADLSQTELFVVDNGAFSSCTSLETVVLPDTLSGIGEAAFFNCVKLTPNGDGGVEAVSGLKNVNIPKNVSCIGSRAFYNCLRLDNMTFESYPTVSDDTFTNVPQKYNVTFLNTDGSVIYTYKTGVNTFASFSGYTGETPTAESTAQYDFEFVNKWDRPFEKVLGDAFYTVDYKEKLRKYTVTWIADGKMQSEQLAYGSDPVFWTDDWAGTGDYHTPFKEGYVFAKWEPLVETVTGNATYTAVFVKAGLGDLNDDGNVDESDIEILSQYLVGVTTLDDEQILRANIYSEDDVSETDREMNINVKDLVFVAQYAHQISEDDE